MRHPFVAPRPLSAPSLGTFSITARDEATGTLGVAVTSEPGFVSEVDDESISGEIAAAQARLDAERDL